MALPALLGAGARAIGGSMVKAGGKAVASKVLGRGKKKQPGRPIPSNGGQGGGGRGGAIVPRTKMVSAKEIKALQTGDTVSPGKDPLKSIYSNVILIEKILKGNNIADRDALKEQKKNDKEADKAAQEKKLETKPPKIDKKKGEIKKLPETGIFGWIKNFIGNILLGYFAVRLIKYLPQILGLLKGLGKVIEFVTDVGMFLVDGIASFINFAYNVYDGTRNIMKGIGLEGAFDAIMKAVEVAITVLTFALGAKSLGGFGGRGGRGGTAKTPKTRVRTKPQEAFQAGRPKRMQPPGTTSPGAASRYARKYGEGAAKRRFGQAAGKKAAQQAAGKLGVKGAARVLGPFVRRIPVIGSLIEFALSVAAGDPPGKAAFRAVGSGLGAWIGGALGTLIPVPFVGTAIGAFIGGAGGAELAGAMYDAFFGGKGTQSKSSKQPEAKQRGGGVSRGFQEETATQQKKANIKKPSYTKIKAPEGGKIKTGEKTEQAYWDFLGWAGTGGKDEMMDLGPGGILLANRVVKVGNSFGEHPFFGPILSLAAKIILGETPKEGEYKNVGYGLNMLIRAGIAKGKIGPGIKGYADGGMVRAMGDVNIGRWATDSFKKELSNTLHKNFDETQDEDEDSSKSSKLKESPGGGVGINPSQVKGAPLGMGQKQAFATVYELAKKHNAKFPEIVAAQAMHETGYLSESIASVFNSTGRTNAFGQTGDRGYGTIPRSGSSVGWTKYPSLDVAVKDNIALWHRVDNNSGNYEAFDRPIDGIASVAPAYSPNADPANIRLGYTVDKYSAAMVKIMKSMGFDPYKANEIADLSNDAKLEGVVPLMEPSERPQAQIAASGNGTMSTGTSGAGMYTGPAGQIGAGAAYHVDTKFHNSIGMGGMISAMDKMADAYTARGKEIVFSGQGYANRKAYKSDLKGGEKQKLLRAAIDAHSHSSFMRAEGFLPFDYYIPSIAANKDLYHPSTEGAEILLPDFGGNKKVGSLYGGYGRSADIYDSSDKHVAMTGHGDLRKSHAGTKLSGREQMLKILPGQSLLDENTSKSLGAATLARLNAASTPEEIRKIAGQIAGVSGYASYEQGAEQTVVVVDPPQQQEEESSQSSGGGMIPVGGGSSHDPFEFLDFQG